MPPSSSYYVEKMKFAKGTCYYKYISMVDEGRLNANDDNKTKST